MAILAAMRSIYPLLALVLATACSGGPESIIDGQAFLSKLEGPKVPTIQDSVTQSARDAEKQGDFKTAAQLYRQVLDKHPNDKNIQLAIADATRRSGDFEGAIPMYDEVLKNDPAMIAAKEGKALALISKGDFETPGPLLEEVLKVDGTRWKTLNALGILFSTRNLNTEAQQYFREALKHNPGSTSVLNNLALAQALDRNFDGAIATLDEAGKLMQQGSQERKRVDLNMALIYAIAGKFDDAKAIAETHYSGAELNNNLGLYAHLAKDDDMAKTYLNMALTESKTFYAKAWDNLQSIDGNSSGKSKKTKPDAKEEPKEEVKPKDSGKLEKQDKPAATPEKKSDGISDIIGAEPR